MDVFEVRQRLIRWGIWLRGGSTRLGSQSSSLMLIRAKMGGGVPLPSVSDEEGAATERVLAELKRHDLEIFEVLLRAYAYGMSNRAIATDLRISASAVQRRIDTGETIVAVKLQNSAITSKKFA